MGATEIVIHARGKNMQDAFRKAQKEAEEEYGHDAYNGEINNCDLIKDVSHKYGEFDEEDFFYEWILNNTSKRDVMGYCTKKPVTNKNKIKTTVTNFPQEGARKFETRYVALNRYGDDPGISEKTQTEAIKKARKYVEENPIDILDVVVEKRLIEGNKTCATIKYKKALNESDGHYVFAGWAPC